MRSAVAVLLAAGFVGVGACSSSSDYFTGPSSIGGGSATEAKGGNGGGGGGGETPVRGTWGTAPVGQVTGISGGDFDGAILDNDSFHAEGDLGAVQITGIPGTSGGTLVLVHMNSVKILPEGDGFARQFVVAWKDGNFTYRLTYGDSNYAHVVCTTVGAPPCDTATMDSLAGQFSSDVDSPTNLNRETGPVATLTKQEGKRKAVGLGSVTVPFSLTVAPTN